MLNKFSVVVKRIDFKHRKIAATFLTIQIEQKQKPKSM